MSEQHPAGTGNYIQDELDLDKSKLSEPEETLTTSIDSLGGKTIQSDVPRNPFDEVLAKASAQRFSDIKPTDINLNGEGLGEAFTYVDGTLVPANEAENSHANRIDTPELQPASSTGNYAKDKVELDPPKVELQEAMVGAIDEAGEEARAAREVADAASEKADAAQEGVNALAGRVGAVENLLAHLQKGDSEKYRTNSVLPGGPETFQEAQNQAYEEWVKAAAVREGSESPEAALADLEARRAEAHNRKMEAAILDGDNLQLKRAYQLAQIAAEKRQGLAALDPESAGAKQAAEDITAIDDKIQEIMLKNEEQSAKLYNQAEIAAINERSTPKGDALRKEQLRAAEAARREQEDIRNFIIDASKEEVSAEVMVDADATTLSQPEKVAQPAESLDERAAVVAIPLDDLRRLGLGDDEIARLIEAREDQRLATGGDDTGYDPDEGVNRQKYATAEANAEADATADEKASEVSAEAAAELANKIRAAKGELRIAQEDEAAQFNKLTELVGGDEDVAGSLLVRRKQAKALQARAASITDETERNELLDRANMLEVEIQQLIDDNGLADKQGEIKDRLEWQLQAEERTNKAEEVLDQLEAEQKAIEADSSNSEEELDGEPRPIGETVVGEGAAGNPALDAKPARETPEEDPIKIEQKKQLSEALGKLASLKAQPFFKRDNEAIKEAEQEYLALTQEIGREMVDGVEDIAERQSVFAAWQIGQWEQVNNQVAELRRETKYGRFVERFGKLPKPARMAIMGVVGVGAGAGLAAGGAAIGVGAAAFATAGVFGMRVARAKIMLDVNASESSRNRKRGKFDAMMGGVARVTGLAKLGERAERNLSKKYNERLEEAIKGLRAEGLDQDELDARIGMETAKSTEAKNKERKKRSLGVMAAGLVLGAGAGYAMHEVLGAGHGDVSTKAPDKGGADEAPIQQPAGGDRQPSGASADEGNDTEKPGGGGGSGEKNSGDLEYTADNIDVNYDEYAQFDTKHSQYSMGQRMDIPDDVSGKEAANYAHDELMESAENMPEHTMQMALAYLSDEQLKELGLKGMSLNKLANELHDDVFRAKVLNAIEESGAKVSVVDNVSGRFSNWGMKPKFDADGNVIDTKLVEIDTTLHDATLVRVVNADGDVSYFNTACKNYLTKIKTGKEGIADGKEANIDGKEGSGDGKEGNSDGKEGSHDGKEHSGDGKEGNDDGKESSRDGKEGNADGDEGNDDKKKSSNPDDYKHKKDAPKAKVDPNQAERTPPRDALNPMNGTEKPGSEVSGNQTGGTADGATGNTGAREEAVDEAQTGNTATSEGNAGEKTDNPF